MKKISKFLNFPFIMLFVYGFKLNFISEFRKNLQFTNKNDEK